MPDVLNYHESLDYSWRRSGKESAQKPDMGLVLVVGVSPVNRVVIGRIVECAGLKVICETPQNARHSLLACQPGTVVFDCGADNSECDCLAPLFEQFRIKQGDALPLLIMLSTPGVRTSGTLLTEFADATVSKPITVDGLQPVLVQLIESARH